jgi:hypothetical protein
VLNGEETRPDGFGSLSYAISEHSFSSAHHYSEHFRLWNFSQRAQLLGAATNGEMGNTRDHCRDAQHPALDELVSLEAKGEMIMRYVALWALGVPISGLIVLHLLGMV